METDIIINRLDKTVSTNSWLRCEGMPAGCLFNVAVASYQEAGRGQKGNSWESEAGENLLMSIMAVPDFIEASGQFCLSEAIALAVLESVTPLLGDESRHMSIKWPNDIYWKEKKLGGILIENTLQGHYLADSIIGLGLNINQTRFLSDAPNPISVAGITGVRHNVDGIMQSVIRHFTDYYILIHDYGIRAVHDRYMERLFRKDGYHRYLDEKGIFEARISKVCSNGIIILEDREGNSRNYEFKQVRAVPDNN